MAMPLSIYTPEEIAALTSGTPSISGVLRELGPSKGEALGRISIPAIELDWMVIEGADLEYLRSGPGHMAWTPVPGQPGNAVISGHRTTYGAPFYNLDLLEPGDLIGVDTLTGTHVYRMHSSVVVPPNGVWVTHQWEGAWLTLTTCNPKGSSAERLVVFAELVGGPNHEAISASTESTPPREPEGA
jgi:sortase A